MQEARQRHGPRSWGRIPDRLFRLDLREGATLAYLILLNEDLGGRAGTVRTSCSELAARLGKTDRSARRWIEALADAGLVEIVANDGGQLTLYVEDADADAVGQVKAGPGPRDEPLFDRLERGEADGGSAAETPSDGGNAAETRRKRRGTAAEPPPGEAGGGPVEERRSQPGQDLRIVGEERDESARGMLRRLPLRPYTSYTSSTSPSHEGDEGPVPVGDLLDGLVERQVEPLSYASPLELAHFARALHGEFVAAGDKRMSLGVCNRVAQALASGRFPRTELRRILEHASQAANCGSYFVKAFKTKCRELGIDFDSLSPERPT